jgi:hypothetical protein
MKLKAIIQEWIMLIRFLEMRMMKKKSSILDKRDRQQYLKMMKNFVLMMMIVSIKRLKQTK